MKFRLESRADRGFHIRIFMQTHVISANCTSFCFFDFHFYKFLRKFRMSERRYLQIFTLHIFMRKYIWNAISNDTRIFECTIYDVLTVDIMHTSLFLFITNEFSEIHFDSIRRAVTKHDWVEFALQYALNVWILLIFIPEKWWLRIVVKIDYNVFIYQPVFM